MPVHHRTPAEIAALKEKALRLLFEEKLGTVAVAARLGVHRAWVNRVKRGAEIAAAAKDDEEEE